MIQRAKWYTRSDIAVRVNSFGNDGAMILEKSLAVAQQWPAVRAR